MRVASPNVKSDSEITSGAMSEAKQFYTFTVAAMGGLSTLRRAYKTRDNVFNVSVYLDELNSFVKGTVDIKQKKPRASKLLLPGAIIIDPVSDDAINGFNNGEPSLTGDHTRNFIGYSEKNGEAVITSPVSDTVLAGNCVWLDENDDDKVYSWDGPLSNDIHPSPYYSFLGNTNTYLNFMVNSLGYNYFPKVSLTFISGSVDIFSFSRATPYIYSEGILLKEAPEKVLGVGVIESHLVCVCMKDVDKDSVFLLVDDAWELVGELDYSSIQGRTYRIGKYSFSQDGTECSTIIDIPTTSEVRTSLSTFTLSINLSLVPVQATITQPVISFTEQADIERVSLASEPFVIPSFDIKPTDKETVLGVTYIDNEIQVLSAVCNEASGGNIGITTDSNPNSQFGTVTTNSTADSSFEINLKLNNEILDYPLTYLSFKDSNVLTSIATLVNPGPVYNVGDIVSTISSTTQITKNIVCITRSLLYADIKNRFFVSEEISCNRKFNRTTSSFEELLFQAPNNIVSQSDVTSADTNDRNLAIRKENLDKETVSERHDITPLIHYGAESTAYSGSLYKSFDPASKLINFRYNLSGYGFSYCTAQSDVHGNFIGYCYGYSNNASLFNLLSVAPPIQGSQFKRANINMLPNGLEMDQVVVSSGDNQALMKFNDGKLRRESFIVGGITYSNINRCIYKL